MGGWKKTRYEMVYVVAWDEAGIMKVGQSGCQRWRRFVLRGGRLLATIPIRTTDDRYLESIYHEAAFRVVEPAFWNTTGEEAIPFLGDRGGYMECYRIPEGVTADKVLTFMHRIVLEQRAWASAARVLEEMPRTKTYPRTYRDVVTK